MRIKILKTGKVSLHPAWGPAVPLTKGQKLSLSQFEKVCKKVDTNPLQAMKDLIIRKYAEEITDTDEVVENDEEGEEVDDQEEFDIGMVDIHKHLTSLIAKLQS